MLRYTLKRIVNAVVIMLLIITVTWLLMQFLPGSPFNDDRLTDTARANLDAKYGLDDPLVVQYGTYMLNVFQGDLGDSFILNNRPVVDIIASRLPVSAVLGAQAIVIGTLGGLVLGAAAAMRHNTWRDRAATVVAVLGISVPSFVLAPLLQYVFAVRLGLFPIAFFDSWLHSVLPSTVLAIQVAAVVATYTRTEMLEVLGQDYVALARAKGLRRNEVIVHHVLRNSMIPLVTIIVPLSAALLTGTLIVERVFAVPGIGDQFVDSVFVNDYTMILGTTILFAAFFVVAYLVQDLLYGVIDPRIRVAGVRE